MRKGTILPIALMALAIVGFLFVIAWAVSPGLKWPWSMKVNANAEVSNASNAVVNTNQNVNADATAGWKTYTAPTAGYSFKYPDGLGNAEIEGMGYLGTLDSQKAKDWEANLAIIDTDQTTEVMYIYAPVVDQVSLKNSIPGSWNDPTKYSKSAETINDIVFDKYTAIGVPDNYVQTGYAVTNGNRHYIISLMSVHVELAVNIMATFTFTK